MIEYSGWNTLFEATWYKFKYLKLNYKLDYQYFHVKHFNLLSKCKLHLYSSSISALKP